ncbi:MAG: hypothetical protein SH850_04735 [Planctomycetaceae bacterium]|nr:hypothetical protein [Planctomycetaceae bacterium]
MTTHPTSPQPIVACWSGGKDSALMLGRLRDDPHYRVVGLITMVTAGDRRISMHGVPGELLVAQAAATGLPLVQAEIPAFPANAIYEAAFARAVDRFRSLGVRTVAFGDLFLGDIRQYREQLCARIEMEALFPLWGEDPSQLAAEFLARGYRATICCADSAKLPREFAGVEYNAGFLADLPAGVDPCGENGEFHTFVTAGPVLSQAIEVEATAVTQSQGFWYAELQSPLSTRLHISDIERRAGRAPAVESAHV